MKAALLLSTLALATAANAQVFSSGFENWADTVPADWMGNKTTLSADSVSQVATNTHSGSYAVRLNNAPSGHKRFTTQDVTVTDGTQYEISFWVRGTGNIRTGLYDGRSTGSGYATYNSYFNSTGNTWTQVVQTITAANDTDAAQFILSVQLTAGPEHLVVDDVNITEAGVVEPIEASVYEIQFTTLPDGSSTFDGLPVITGGIVTGVDTIGANSYFIQAGSGPWSGVYVYDQANAVNIGDSVLITATVDEFNGVTELVNVTSFSVVGQYPVPAPQPASTAVAPQEQWEGVLVIIANAACTVLPNGFGEWTISQQGTDLLVDDLMYPYTPAVGTNYDVTGCMHYANGAWKLEPRIADDVVLATSLAENAFGSVVLGPNPASELLMVRTSASGSVSYLLSDALGRAVRSGRFTGSTAVDVRDLNAGLYHLTLQQPSGASTRAVQVVR